MQERDPGDWRRHEVPTYTEAQDTWLFGMSFRQLIGAVIAASVGYAVYIATAFLPEWYFRAGAGVLVFLILMAFVTIKPGGRPLSAILFDIFQYMFGKKHYSTLMRHLIASTPIVQLHPQRVRSRRLMIPIPLPNNTLYISVPVPSFRRVSSSSMLLLASGMAAGLMLQACGATPKASAQEGFFDHFVGERVYAQSVLIKRGLDNDNLALYLKAAAPLRNAQPRLNETRQSTDSYGATSTHMRPAQSYGDIGSGIIGFTNVLPATAIPRGQTTGTDGEFAFLNVSLADRYYHRPYCDVPVEGGARNTADPGNVLFRSHDRDCRLQSPLDFILGNISSSDLDYGIGNEYSVSKPLPNIAWQDARLNAGFKELRNTQVPYPAPTLVSADRTLFAVPGDTDSAELLNPEELCDPDQVAITQVGIQSERPSSSLPPEYLFTGEGRRVGFKVQICSLTSPANARLILPEMAVLDRDNASGGNFEMTVRALVETESRDKITTTAVVRILDSENDDNLPAEAVIDVSESGYDLARDDLGKVIEAHESSFDTSSDSLPEDSVRAQVQVELVHTITVTGPEHQPVDFWPERWEFHIERCGGCSSSGGS